MKRVLVIMACMAMGAFLFSEEAVLIDFSKLNADKELNVGTKDQPKVVRENLKTIMDFSKATNSGSSVQVAEGAGNVMITSLAIENWEVVLASSSRTVENQSLSEVKAAQVSAQSKKYPGMTVMGVRIHFPVESFNSWALIKPPFEIPAFEPAIKVEDNGKVTDLNKDYYKKNPSEKPTTSKYSRFEGDESSVDTLDPDTGATTGKKQKVIVAYGVVKNVGCLKSIAVNVFGMNFPHGLSVVLKDENGNERTFFMGYLNFDGWKELRWNNPAYIEETRNRELRIFPLYPKSAPYYKFQGFVITRDAAHDGGDFVGYFKDVKLIYDVANDPSRIEEFANEDIWGIEAKREADRKKVEFSRFGNQQVLRYLEDIKKATENFDAESYEKSSAAPAAGTNP